MYYLIQATLLPSSFRSSNLFSVYLFLIFPTISLEKIGCHDFNGSTMPSFVELFDTLKFEQKCDSLELDLKDFLMWVGKAAFFSAKDIMSKMKRKLSRRESELNESKFLISEKMVLQDIGTEQIVQVIRASLAIHTYKLKYGRIWKLFIPMSSDQDYPASLLSGARFLHLVLNGNVRVKAMIPYVMSVPTTFEAQLYFNSISCSTER